jgi:phospholipase C
MSTPTRRDVLKGGLAGVALSGCTTPATDDSGGSSAGQIDHVVVVMMENRSFDHYLGGLTLAGRDDVDGLTGTESNPDAQGVEHTVFPFTEYCQEDPPHGWGDSHSQFNGGAMDGFVLEHEDRVGTEQAAWVMGYYGAEQLPVHWALAQHYCVPDAFFCSVMSSTWPNRFYGQTGTSKGMRGNDPHPDGYDQKSVYQAVAESGHEWNYFYTDVPFIGLLDDHWDEDRIGTIDEFFGKAQRGELPEFTWIDPGFSYNDDHPPHHVILGQLFLALVYEALVQSPNWERTLLVITYDEHGGFYDHVPPPTTDDDHAADGFDQLGFRVPALIVGPWVKQGADHTVYDNTSVLKYVCERFGIEPWTARIAAANSLSGALDLERMESGIPLDAVELPTFEVPEEVPKECNYDLGLTSTVTATPGGQPELEAWVEQHMPWADKRDDIPQTHAHLLELARQYGLLREVQ